MKKLNTLMILLTLALSFGCGQSGVSNVELKMVLSGMVADYPAGVMLYGKNNSLKDTYFGQHISADAEVLTLQNGDWEFFMVAWDGTAPFQVAVGGEMKCASVQKSLNGGDEPLDFILTSEACFDCWEDNGAQVCKAAGPLNSDLGSGGIASAAVLKSLKIETMVALSPDATINTTNTSFEGFYRVGLVDFSIVNGIKKFNTTGVFSECISMSTGVDMGPGLKFPAPELSDLGPKPFAAQLVLFSDSTCRDRLNEYIFPEGLGTLDVNQHITHLDTVTESTTYKLQVVHHSPTSLQLTEGTALLGGSNGPILIFPVADSPAQKIVSLVNNGTAITTLGISLMSSNGSIKKTIVCGTSLAAGDTCDIKLDAVFTIPTTITAFDIVNISFVQDGISQNAYLTVTGKSLYAFNQSQTLFWGGDIIYLGILEIVDLYTNSSDVVARWQKPESNNVLKYSVQFYSKFDCSLGEIGNPVIVDGGVYSTPVFSSATADGSSIAYKVSSLGVGDVVLSTSECSEDVTVASAPPVVTGLSFTTDSVALSISWVNPTQLSNIVEKHRVILYKSQFMDEYCMGDSVEDVEVLGSINSYMANVSSSLEYYSYRVISTDFFGRSVDSGCSSVLQYW